MNPHLQISNISKIYGRNAALTEVSLEVERGACLAVLGANGAGKSTLFGCVLGFTRPTSGEVLLDGGPIRHWRRAQFGYTAERVALYWDRSVRENAVLFATMKGHSEADALAQVERLGLAAILERPVRALSKGMLQRLGLAVALCGKPELLVLDEPFNGLDPVLLEIFQAVLQEEVERGATLLLSTHTISAVEPLASHVAVLSGGRLASFGAKPELRSRYIEEPTLERIYHRIAREAQPGEPVSA